MPKLNKKIQAVAETAEAVSGEFKPLDPGKYVATLAKVEARTSQAGNPMWNWEFTDIHSLDGEKQPGRQWYITMMPQDKPPKGTTDTEKWETGQRLSAGRLRAAFEAFGYTLDSDTDEMIGEKVVLSIGIETISKGAKAGQQTNRVNALLSIDDYADSPALDGEDEDGEF